METTKRLDAIGKILEEKGFSKFAHVPKVKGFSVAGSCNPNDLVFLGHLNNKVPQDTLKDGLVVCAIGFGDDSKTMLEKYVQALEEEGIVSEILGVELGNIFERGAYLFVPH